MRRSLAPAALIAAWTAILGSGPAPAGSGVYLGSELGANFGASLEMAGEANDRASVCDEYINPLFATVTATPGYETVNCTGPNRGQGDGWENDFGAAEGILLGAAFGYRLPDKFARFRVELEYFYRDTNYDETSSIPSAGGVSGDELTQEILTATDHIGSVTSHNLFGNLYVDFAEQQPLHALRGVWRGGGIYRHGLRQSVGAQPRSQRDYHGRRVAQRGRHPSESCRDDLQGTDRTE